jgi:hypothetical protein
MLDRHGSSVNQYLISLKSVITFCDETFPRMNRHGSSIALSFHVTCANNCDQFTYAKLTNIPSLLFYDLFIAAVSTWSMQRRVAG